MDCPTCAAKVADSASKCPRCGVAFVKWAKPPAAEPSPAAASDGLLWIVVSAVAALLVLGYLTLAHPGKSPVFDYIASLTGSVKVAKVTREKVNAQTAQVTEGLQQMGELSVPAPEAEKPAAVEPPVGASSIMSKVQTARQKTQDRDQRQADELKEAEQAESPR